MQLPIYFCENLNLKIFFCQNKLRDSAINSTITKHLNLGDEATLKKVLNNYRDIYYEEGSNLPSTSKIQHRIRTKKDLPFYAKLIDSEIDRQTNV